MRQKQFSYPYFVFLGVTERCSVENTTEPSQFSDDDGLEEDGAIHEISVTKFTFLALHRVYEYDAGGFCIVR